MDLLRDGMNKMEKASLMIEAFKAASPEKREQQ